MCTTGAEALYSDLGHCGRNNIRISWVFVKICLGQGQIDKIPQINRNIQIAFDHLSLKTEDKYKIEYRGRVSGIV